MKTISYTKMRDELADVLEALRGGEPVTITQRGKADIVISAQTGVGVSPPAQPDWRKSNTEIKNANETKAIVKTGNSLTKRAQKLLSFQEAKSRTQSKHASIIKALEDK